MNKEPYHESWHKRETFKSLVSYGQNAVKFVLLVNGGALVAVLGLLGSIYAKTCAAVNFQGPAICFVVGLCMGGLGFTSAYLTQLTLYRESIGERTGSEKLNHMTWVGLTLGLIAVGTLMFLSGALWATSVLHG
ncbi:hypothetical protein C4900_05125 [Acidiferrobacter thiooxydans]|uniref:Uncharacterized protein n=1 Tax=Acidiferrobacter thiooxydans TaxID=163359 RepID=A0A368HI99_9GAMM|nr:hypothetical protein C4900_05125 [Acidiferrobacter thiooxydans]